MENEGDVINSSENYQLSEKLTLPIESQIPEPAEKRTDRLKMKFTSWLKDPYNKIFLAIFIFATVIRIYYFWLTKDQAAWWDAADYLTQAKYLGGLLKIDYMFNPRRPFLMAILWGLLFKIGFGEISLGVTELIFSTLAVPAIYLAGKTIFNKKVGLISAFLMSIFYLHLFFSFRLMTEIPTLTFFIFAMYFFWEGYIKKKNKMLIWFGVFFGLSLLSRGASSVMSFIFPLFLILSDIKLKFVKNKYLWLSVIIAGMVFSTFFVFIYFKENLNPVTYYLALSPEFALGGEGRFASNRIWTFPTLYQYIAYFPTYFGIALLIPFVLGVLMLGSNLILNFDLLIKDKSFKLKKELFVVSWILVPLIFQGLFAGGGMEPRYLMMAFPPLFMVTSIGLLKIGDLLKKYHKHILIIVIVGFLLFGAYYQLKSADNLIKSKKDSYYEVKLAGEWIKANSDPSDVIISASVPQNVYYSERETYNIFQPYMNKTAFEEKIFEIHPTFLVISVFEPYMQDWMFTYPQEHPELLVPVQAYTQNEKPVLIIYKVQYSNGNISF